MVVCYRGLVPRSWKEIDDQFRNCSCSSVEPLGGSHPDRRCAIHGGARRRRSSMSRCATIKRDLDFSEASLQWVITAYAIVFGGVLLLGGRLADLLGRRRIFMAGIALFTFGSILSRPRLVGRLARRLPGHPGTRRGALRTRGALASDDHLPRGSRPQHRPRDLGRSVGERRRRRRAARRRPDVVPLAGPGSSSSTCRSGSP